MHRIFSYLLFIVASFTFLPTIFSQNIGNDIKVRLSLAENKNIYRKGEPIRLVLSFTANTGEFTIDKATSMLASSYDELILSPDAGIYYWAKDYRNEDNYFPNPLLFRLSHTSINVELLLNSFVRIDKPGRYSAKLKTRRASTGDFWHREAGQLSLITNEITFEVKEMSGAEERTEVERLSALLKSTASFREQQKIIEDLSCLTGEYSTHEKVRLFSTSQREYENILFGLFIARNRMLAITLLENRLLGAGNEISLKLVDTLSKLKVLEEFKNSKAITGTEAQELAKQKINRFLEIREVYLKKLGRR